MKHTLALIGIAGLATLVFSSAGFAQKDDEAKEKTKTRHIKLEKIENGKKMELDTIVTGNDVFVWKGDTIGTKEMAKRIASDVTKKMKRIKVIVDGDDKDENVMIYHMKNGKKGEPMMHMNMMKDQHAGRIIDLNDPNIISYRKKSLKGGREKIEIIRNKPNESQDMNFSYNIGDNLDVPEPPEPPQAPNFDRNQNDNHNETKIIEKDEKVNAKEDKEIKVEVETNDQK